MGNVVIGADGIPFEQDDDGAFYVTQEKVNDSKKFEEVVNGLDARGTEADESD